MRITEIQVDRYGVWRNLSLPLSGSGMNVFYGPNEAGKSTLLRFLRGVLYGFAPPQQSHRHAQGATVYEGRLRVEHGRHTCEIHRTSHGESHGLLSVTGLDREASADELLAELVSETEQPIFDRVFAIGLLELQELATLNHQQVAQRIYDISLGPDTRRLLDATEKIETDRRLLLDPPHTSGRLVQLFEQQAQLARQLEPLSEQRNKHARLSAERDELQSEIALLKRKQATIGDEVRGRQFLEQVYTPWKNVRELQAELDRIPAMVGFPEGGSARLAELDRDLAAARKCRDDLLTEAAEYRKQADALRADAELIQHEAGMRGFLDQRDWLLELGRDIKQAEARAGQAKERLSQQLGHLGPEWSLERLEQVDTSPSAHFRLTGAARTYQNALSRRARLRRRLKSLSSKTRRKAAELKEHIRPLGDTSLQDAVRQSRLWLDELEDLGRLKLRLSELEQRRIGIGDQLHRLGQKLNLPKWVYAVLIFFGLSGFLFFLLGIVTGTTTNWLAGLMYALLGGTCGFMAWALKNHFERHVRIHVEQLEHDAQEVDSRLRETQAAVDRITSTSAPKASPNGQPDADAPSQEATPIGLIVASRPDDLAAPQKSAARQTSEADLMHQAAHRLAELEQWRETEYNIDRARQKLSSMRARYQALSAETSTARQHWCGLLKQLGLAETVRVAEAFNAWQGVVEANEQRRQWEAARQELHDRQQQLHAFRVRLEEQGRRIQNWDVDYSRPLDVLNTWDEKLKSAGQHRQERRRLRNEERVRRREAADYRRQIEDLKLQRSALLVQGGAATSDEFEQRAQLIQRRQKLEVQLSDAQEELAAAAALEPNLALVEEDLLSYDADENLRSLEANRRDLEEINVELELLHERLGACKQEISNLESDRSGCRLRLQRELVAEQLRQTAAEWFGTQAAANVVDQIRQRYERDCQPAILSAASKWLERLTNGRYHKVWTPLGQRRLRVDDHRQETLTVEQLSGGTREQLFLAVRLALAQDLADRGVELPLVLDDILVNFDQSRTEAAVDTLLELAGQGRQVLLLTCHLHLAHLFESKGISPVWLPPHQHLLEERRAG